MPVWLLRAKAKNVFQKLISRILTAKIKLRDKKKEESYTGKNVKAMCKFCTNMKKTCTYHSLPGFFKGTFFLFQTLSCFFLCLPPLILLSLSFQFFKCDFQLTRRQRLLSFTVFIFTLYEKNETVVS